MPTLIGLVSKLSRLTGHGVARNLHRRDLRILMYHRFPDDTRGLRSQCELIRRQYAPVTMADVARAYAGGASLPDNAVAVTIDDGFRDFLHAAPVFAEFGIRPTVFLVSGFLDGELWLWLDQVRYAYQHSQKALGNERERRAAARATNERLKNLPDEQRLHELKALFKELSVAIPPQPPAHEAPLTWDEVRRLSREGVEFGAHTHTHPILSRVTPDKLRFEIEHSRDRIAAELSQPVVHFCYPNGRSQDIDDSVVGITRAAGFQTGVTTLTGRNTISANPLLLDRLGIEPEAKLVDYLSDMLAGTRNN